MTTTTDLTAERLPAGGAIFRHPSMGALAVLWLGPGSDRLHLVSNRPGSGLMTLIDHPSGHLERDSYVAARKGAAAFVAAGKENGA